MNGNAVFNRGGSTDDIALAARSTSTRSREGRLLLRTAWMIVLAKIEWLPAPTSKIHVYVPALYNSSAAYKMHSVRLCQAVEILTFPANR